MSLAESILKTREKAPEELGTDPEAIARLLRAKSGRVSTGATPAPSAIMSRTALAQAQTAEQQQQVAQDANRAVLAEQAAQQGQKIGLAQKASAQEYKQKLNEVDSQNKDLIQQYKQEYEKLGDKADASKVELASTIIRVQNQRYVNKLQLIAKERQLEDEHKFQQEALRLSLGDELDDLAGKLGFKTAMEADQREFDKKMAKMSYSNAVALSQAAIAAANSQAKWQGGFTVLKSGLDLASKAAEIPSAKPKNRPGTDGGLGGPEGK